MNIVKKLFLLMTLLSLTPAAFAEVYIASDTKSEAHRLVAGGRVVVVTDVRRSHSIASGPDVFQALAAAITQTAVRQETQDVRLRKYDGDVQDVIVRKHRLTMRYTAMASGARCYLAVGPAQKWATIDGDWHGRQVNTRALARALDVLRQNRLYVRSVTISTRTPQELVVAKRLLHSLRLQAFATVGCDPDAPNSATISFTTKTIN